MVMPICFRILGNPLSKANSRQIVDLPVKKDGVNTGKVRPASIKSEDALAYEKSALKQIPPFARQMLEGDVKVTMRIFYVSERSDLDESLILDILQARYKTVRFGNITKRELIQRGVYVNDRQVRWKDIRHGIDTVNPRAEIMVEPMTPQQDDMWGGLETYRPDLLGKSEQKVQLDLPEGQAF